MLKYRQGDSLILANPNDNSLRGAEVEVVRIHSKDKKIYEILVLETNKRHYANETQLAPLDDANTLTSWEDCAWRP